MLKCTACGKFISSNAVANCSICPCLYHKECVSLSDTASVSKDWACPQCKKKVPKNDNTPVRGVSTQDSGATAISRRQGARPITSTTTAATTTTTAETATTATASKTTATVKPPAESPIYTTTAATSKDAPGTDLHELRRELSSCISEMREFRQDMAELRVIMAGIHTRMDGFEHRLEAVEQLRSIEPPATKEVAELERTVARLKVDLNERDQEALLSDLEIGHLPEEKGENILHSVTVLAAKLGVKFEERDVVFAERVGAAQLAGAGDKPRVRRVVVRLARRDLRDQLLQAARVRRSLNASDAGRAAPQQRIFLNERLTRVNRQLFHSVREECRRHQWRYSWTKRGRIYARQSDGKAAFPIRTEADVSRVFGSL